MQKNFCFRFLVVMVLTVAVVVSFYPNISQAARFRRIPRQRSSVSAETARPATKEKTPIISSTMSTLTLSPEAAKEQLKTLCEQVKSDYKKITPDDLKQSKQRLLESAQSLLRLLNRDPDKEAATAWKEEFHLTELLAILQKPETPDKTFLDTIWNALHSNKKGVRRTIFDNFRKSLRQYQSLERLVSDNSYESQLVKVCDHLLDYLKTYSGNRDPLHAVALNDVMVWLEDVGAVEPRTLKIADLVRVIFSGVNLQVQAGSEFVGAGFQSEISEDFKIDENILGTRVVGTGTLNATSSAELVPNKNKAEIKVLIKAAMNSATTGYHSPVTVNTDTKGTLSAEKRIQLAPEAFSTVPTKTQANLKASLSNVRINGGPLVQMIAKQQIQEQRASSQSVARQRAEKRMSLRVDNRIDPKIEELNENYQTKIRTPLVQTGLFPRIWNLSSTADRIDWSLLIGSPTQPSAMNPAPVLDKPHDLVVQVHQSALNNAAALALSGRFLDEDEFVKDLQEQFPKLPKFLERKQDESPAQVSFVAKAPIDVLFVDNKIKVVIRLDDIKVLNNSDKSYTITILYNVSVGKKKDQHGVERDIVILDQAETPQAFPSNYQPESGVKLSAIQTMIRSYLLRRLEALPQRVETEPLEVGGEWQGTGVLVPVFASSDHGWLTFACDWVPTEKKPEENKQP
ncbi:MAG: hypothetical protein LBI18_14930 [Planctomycetaceae bacterium]|jgi:hypothetical protein|nr:hypothetical protein [Planctomycetaceae bacterium]